MKFEDYEVLAKKAYSEKKYREAIDWLAKALAIKVDKNLLYLKGLALYKAQCYEEAIECFTRTLELDSELKDVWEAKGNALCQIWKFREAVKCYENALRLSYEPRLKEKIKQLTYIWDY